MKRMHREVIQELLEENQPVLDSHLLASVIIGTALGDTMDECVDNTHDPVWLRLHRAGVLLDNNDESSQPDENNDGSVNSDDDNDTNGGGATAPSSTNTTTSSMAQSTSDSSDSSEDSDDSDNSEDNDNNDDDTNDDVNMDFDADEEHQNSDDDDNNSVSSTNNPVVGDNTVARVAPRQVRTARPSPSITNTDTAPSDPSHTESAA